MNFHNYLDDARRGHSHKSYKHPLDERSYSIIQVSLHQMISSHLECQGLKISPGLHHHFMRKFS
eukprot:Gb_29610 [translate_table: standard]